MVSFINKPSPQLPLWLLLVDHFRPAYKNSLICVHHIQMFNYVVYTACKQTSILYSLLYVCVYMDGGWTPPHCAPPSVEGSNSIQKGPPFFFFFFFCTARPTIFIRRKNRSRRIASHLFLRVRSSGGGGGDGVEMLLWEWEISIFSHTRKQNKKFPRKRNWKIHW